MSIYTAIKDCEDCYLAKKDPILRLLARKAADRAIDDYLTSPQEKNAATRRRVSELPIECAECDYSKPIIAIGLKGLFNIKG